MKCIFRIVFCLFNNRLEISGVGIKRPKNYNDLIRILGVLKVDCLAPANYVPGVGRGARGFVTQ